MENPDDLIGSFFSEIEQIEENIEGDAKRARVEIEEVPLLISKPQVIAKAPSIKDIPREVLYMSTNEDAKVNNIVIKIWYLHTYFHICL
jgi:hypothetical protein